MYLVYLFTLNVGLQPGQGQGTPDPDHRMLRTAPGGNHQGPGHADAGGTHGHEPQLHRACSSADAELCLALRSFW